MTQTLTVSSTAPSAIAFPNEAKQSAQAAIAAYLAMLKRLPETRLALAGNGSAVVQVPDRSGHLYARLGGASGDVIEARIINLLAPADGDSLLVRRERPGGAGGWVVVEWLGTGAPPILICNDAMRFWVNLGQSALFEVTALSAGGGTGSIVYTVGVDEILYWLGAPDATRVVKVNSLATNNYGFQRSADGGATWGAYDYENAVDVFAFFFSFWQMVYQDLTNADTLFASIFFFHGISYGGSNYNWTRLFATPDGGATWNILEYDPGSVRTSRGVIGIPRHNDTDGFFISALSSTTNYYNHIELVTKNGVSTESYDLATNAMTHTTPNGFTANGAAFRACVQYGNPDNLFILPFNSEANVFLLEWSTKALTNLGNWWAGSPNAAGVHKQILSTRAGTILIMDSWSNGGSGAWMIVWRSTDAGATWTGIDLTSEMVDPRPFDTWDYIAIAGDDTLFIPLSDGTGLFSVDDGVTWTRTGDFIPVGTYGDPHEVVGSGL